jgi:hypothetical protein
VRAICRICSWLCCSCILVMSKVTCTCACWTFFAAAAVITRHVTCSSSAARSPAGLPRMTALTRVGRG